MRAPTAFILLAALIGCGSGGANNGAQTETAEQPANDASATPASPPASPSAAPTAAWLAGRWQSDGPGQCGAGDSAFTLEPGGRYAFMEEQGRWALEGDRLTIEVTQQSSDSGTEAGQRNSVEVRMLGQDEAEWRPQNQPPIHMYRCPA